MAPGPDNPHLNGFTAVETDLTTTAAAQRLTAPDKVGSVYEATAILPLLVAVLFEVCCVARARAFCGDINADSGVHTRLDLAASSIHTCFLVASDTDKIHLDSVLFWLSFC
jgi:hypothetical protein